MIRWNSIRSLWMAAAFAAVALLALACDGGGEAQPTATAEPATGEVDVRDLLLLPEDVPPELGQLSSPIVQMAQEITEGILNPEEQLEAIGTVTLEEAMAWGVVSSATQFHNSRGQYPTEGAQHIVVSVTLTDAVAGATALFPFTTRILKREAVAEYEAYPGRSVVEYEELAEPTIGEESRMVHFISVDLDEPVRLEHYQLVFRRDRVVSLIQVRSPEGNVTLEQVTDLADKLDGRIQDGLR